MGCREATTNTAVYRPRNPRASPLYQCVQQHFDELDASGAIHRQVERTVLERFIDCGDLHKGFARIYCDECGHDYLLAFSCKTRYFCPSCHQKRMLAYGDWVEDEVLAKVSHRQYVFTLPKLLRPHFHRRYRLGALCSIVARLLKTAFEEAAPDDRPGFILFVQTFGDLVNFHPHIHALVTDGVFSKEGVFRVLPPIPMTLLEGQLRHEVIEYLQQEEAITFDFAQNLLGWRHSGFSVHNGVRVPAHDREGHKQLARYMVRNPFSLEKMQYKEKQGVVVYRSRMHATLKRNFQIMSGAEWLKLLIRHIPDKGEHLVRYYGWYSSRSRGIRKALVGAEKVSGPAPDDDPADPEFVNAARAAWARLIQKVYEVDPLVCPHCGGEMRFLAVIEDEPVIERILQHVKAWDPRPPLRGPPVEEEDWPVDGQIPLTYGPVPDIA